MTEEKLAKLELRLLGEIRTRTRTLEELRTHFGRYGQRLYKLARAIDENPVVPTPPTQSISAEETFEQLAARLILARIRWPRVAEPLVAVKVGSVKSIEHVPYAIREGTILVGFELEIERVVDPEQMDRPPEEPSEFLHLQIGALNSEDPIAPNHLRHERHRRSQLFHAGPPGDILLFRRRFEDKNFDSLEIAQNALHLGSHFAPIEPPITEGLRAAGFMEGERYEAAVKRTPLGRTGQPDDIGKIAVFLASDEAYWITGQRIQAAGGFTLWYRDVFAVLWEVILSSQ